MREGYELKLYNVFCKLLHQHELPVYAVRHLDWLVFQEHKDEFWSLPQEDQMEIRFYLLTLKQLFGE